MSGSTRPVAICVFERNDALLVSRSRDEHRSLDYCRPPGGGIEFRERAADAIRREIREETRQEISQLELVGVLENVFELEAAPKHEIIFVFRARFADPTVYELSEIPLYEDGWDGRLSWVPLADLRACRPRLVPDGLLELLDAAG